MAIRVGIAPDSWGVWFPEHEKQTPWYRCMDEMKVAGYDGVELGPWGYFPNKNPMLKNALDARGLSLVAGTVGGDFLDGASIDAMCQTIDDIAVLLKDFDEAKYIVLLPAMYTDLETGEPVCDPNLTDAQWATYCKTCSARLTASRPMALSASFIRTWIATYRRRRRLSACWTIRT